jgi:hypothetical protein
MQKSTVKQVKPFLLFLTWVILGLYCFIAFLPLPTAIKVGIDPSWQYAMSRAAADGLIFGRDVIFTGGPFGYLIYGAPLEENLFLITAFRVLVHLALFIIATVRIVRLEKTIQKISFSLSLFIAYWIGRSPNYQGFFNFTDYQILFIFLIILSFDSFLKKSLRWWSLGLGAFAGFCLLTKFTLGISTLGSLILFLLAYLYRAIKSKSGVTIAIFAIINSLFAAISVSFVLLAPAYSLTNLSKILISLAVSGTAAAFTWLIQQRINHRKNYQDEGKSINNNILNNLRFKLVSWGVLYLVYSICLFSVIANSFPSWTDYLKTSLEVSSGYSSAMSLVSSREALGLAISVLVVISILIIFIAIQGSLELSVALIFTLVLAFKHGFVRQDVHMLLFAASTPVISALCSSKIRRFRFQRIAYFMNLYVLIIAIIFQIAIMFHYAIKYNLKIGGLINSGIAPSQVISNLSYLSDFNSLQYSVKAKSAANLSKVKLPHNVLSLVKDKTVDIIPWELSLVEANHLNWKPSPNLLSIEAYTTTLDNINFESFFKEPRDYIFYNFSSIDDRHPFFDQPKTFSSVFCNYEPSSASPDFIHTSSLSNIILLAKRKSSRCSPTTLGETVSIPWNASRSIDVSDEAIIRSNIKFKYSILGKIYKTIFRAPPVMMQVDYADGSRKKYRIIPENSDNGVIVSHLPRTDREAMSFFQGQLPAQVKSFGFSTSNSLLYTPNIEMTFSSYKLLEPSIKQRP